MIFALNAAIMAHRYRAASLIGCSAFVLGDMIIQKNQKKPEFDWKRNRAFGLFGFFFGPISTLYYVKVLPRWIPVSSLSSAFKAALFTEGLRPFLIVPNFIISTDLFRGRRFPEIREHMRKDYRETAIGTFLIRFPTAIINMRFIPLHLRFFFESCVTILWATMASYTTNRNNNNVIVLNEKKQNESVLSPMFEKIAYLWSSEFEPNTMNENDTDYLHPVIGAMTLLEF